ncbi:DUF938 domain-containing protein [Blastomonas sp.]|uniref:DUF938 domain-containing protein n=1 Tax=Blastomonas sp. TaxID=1909299 RepID=UPI003593C58C
MADPKPWLIDEAGSEARRHAPATVRNRDAIAAVLADILPACGSVLEIASGSGEHVTHFAGLWPQLTWQPSDAEPASLASIAAWTAQSGLSNVAEPILIDVERRPWPIARADALLCINMAHISPWTASEALFCGAAAVLPTGAPLFIYGPFLRHDVMTAQSNIDFDASLKARNPSWGLRDVSAMDVLGQAHGLLRERLFAMPANNIALVYRSA